MRGIQFFLILSIGLLIGACGKEDNRMCTQADFIGNYGGGTECANRGIAGATLEIIAGATATQLIVESGGATFEVDIDGCDFSGFQKDDNADLVYSGNLNGDEVEFRLQGIVFGRRIDCTTTGTRQ